jgi:hypothetical protein
MIHWAWLIAAFYGGMGFAFMLFALLSAASDKPYPAPGHGQEPEGPRVTSLGGIEEKRTNCAISPSD